MHELLCIHEFHVRPLKRNLIEQAANRIFSYYAVLLNDCVALLLLYYIILIFTKYIH